MTSSLVGSEMCIRDRDRKKEVGKVVRSMPAFVRVATVVAFMEEQSDGTVSYTHLTLPTICSV
eukprot:9688143-Prorocentrum_lima.AAC.1